MNNNDSNEDEYYIDITEHYDAFKYNTKAIVKNGYKSFLITCAIVIGFLAYIYFKFKQEYPMFYVIGLIALLFIVMEYIKFRLLLKEHIDFIESILDIIEEETI